MPFSVNVEISTLEVNDPVSDSLCPLHTVFVIVVDSFNREFVVWIVTIPFTVVATFDVHVETMLSMSLFSSGEYLVFEVASPFEVVVPTASTAVAPRICTKVDSVSESGNGQ